MQYPKRLVACSLYNRSVKGWPGRKMAMKKIAKVPKRSRDSGCKTGAFLRTRFDFYSRQNTTAPKPGRW